MNKLNFFSSSLVLNRLQTHIHIIQNTKVNTNIINANMKNGKK